MPCHRSDPALADKNRLARPPLRTRNPTVAQMKPLVGKPPTFTLKEADAALVEKTNLALMARPPPPASDEDLVEFLHHPSINSGRLNLGAFTEALAYAGTTTLEEMCDPMVTTDALLRTSVGLTQTGVNAVRKAIHNIGRPMLLAKQIAAKKAKEQQQIQEGEGVGGKGQQDGKDEAEATGEGGANGEESGWATKRTRPPPLKDNDDDDVPPAMPHQSKEAEAAKRERRFRPKGRIITTTVAVSAAPLPSSRRMMMSSSSSSSSHHHRLAAMRLQRQRRRTRSPATSSRRFWTSRAR